VSRDRTDEPIQFVEGAMKLRNGLFLRRVALYDDRIAFEVFASRVLLIEEIADISLTDDVGTKYEMASPESKVVEGKAEIEFRPAPTGLSGLRLSQLGWAPFIADFANDPVSYRDD
jgi:hypothetical protein